MKTVGDVMQELLRGVPAYEYTRYVDKVNARNGASICLKYVFNPTVNRTKIDQFRVRAKSVKHVIEVDQTPTRILIFLPDIPSNLYVY